MNYFIVGTAGHVDHGKSQLIKALTGEETDRLKEEKERGISIELGFASLKLPSGASAGVVDVPGHEKFVRQMLAGIGGIDLVLLVIAADEGIMPQTQEHLDIIDLLQVHRGIVVLTKIDLVDQEWADLVKSEIRETLKGTVLEQAVIIEVSALTGQGLDKLTERIDQELQHLPPRDISGPCRLPIDRVFSVPGFGTIVTGTLQSGKIKLGETLKLQPGDLEIRVRSLQVHGHQVETAFAGQRVAVNLPNIEVANVPKGGVLTTPGYLSAVQTVDATLRYLASAKKPLLHRQRVRFHIGTKEVFGRIHLLEGEQLEPGHSAYIQVLLEEPVIANKGDKFVIRSYSPIVTIGGGTILASGNRKHRRYDASVLNQLAVAAKGNPAELVTAQLKSATVPLGKDELAIRCGLDQQAVEVALAALEGSLFRITVDDRKYWFSPELLHSWTEKYTPVLNQYQQKYCLRPGLPKEEFKSRFFAAWNAKLYSVLLSFLQAKNLLSLNGNFISLPGFIPGPQGELEPIAKKILDKYREGKLAPPDWGAITGEYNLKNTADELLQYFLRKGQLIKVAQNLYFSAQEIDMAQQAIEGLLLAQGQFTVAEAREKLKTSRKYLIPILEFFDNKKITRRIGDKRAKF